MPLLRLIKFFQAFIFILFSFLLRKVEFFPRQKGLPNFNRKGKPSILTNGIKKAIFLIFSKNSFNHQIEAFHGSQRMIFSKGKN